MRLKFSRVCKSYERAVYPESWDPKVDDDDERKHLLLEKQGDQGIIDCVGACWWQVHTGKGSPREPHRCHNRFSVRPQRPFPESSLPPRTSLHVALVAGAIRRVVGA